ncbi:MAG: hypothetical protein ACKOGD_11320 [Sphingomonadales bacterium]
MKFILFFFLSLFCIAGQAQGVFRGSVLLNAYVGFPNIMKLSIPSTEYYADLGTVSYKNSLPPSGLRLMYMAADQVSVGLDLIYSTAHAEVFQSDSSFFNGQWQINTNTYLIEKKQFRPQFRLDIHMSSLDPNLDQYAGFAIGANYRHKKIYQNGALINTSGNDIKNLLFPISMRVCYGARYFFDYNFAVGGEVGFGGPLLQFSMTYRI